MPLGWSDRLMSIRSEGRELTNSVRRRDGIVIEPSVSTWAPIHVLMAISFGPLMLAQPLSSRD